MKNLQFSSEEIELLFKAMDHRKIAHKEAILNADIDEQNILRKELQRIVLVCDAFQCSPTRISSMDRAWLKGCVDEALVTPLDDERIAMANMTEPDRYKYIEANKESIQHMNRVLALWNKLEERREQRESLPMDHWEVIDRIRSTVFVHCSFTDTKPYKLALVQPDGSVFRIKPDSSKSNLQGPLRYTREALRDLYTHELSPSSFCDFLKKHGISAPLNTWHMLIIELLSQTADELLVV
jgi:hypothetical protein